MKKEDEKSLEDYINQFKKDERDRIIKLLKDMMPQSTDNAKTHFIKQDYEELSNDCQHEYEGLMWGWQDAIRIALKKIGEFEMINKQWFDTEKKIDPNFAGSLFEEIGFDKELCPTCGSHLKDKICLNACHLSKETREKFNKFLTESKNENSI